MKMAPKSARIGQPPPPHTENVHSFVTFLWPVLRTAAFNSCFRFCSKCLSSRNSCWPSSYFWSKFWAQHRNPFSAVKRHCMFGVFLFLPPPSPTPLPLAPSPVSPFSEKFYPHSMNRVKHRNPEEEKKYVCINQHFKYSLSLAIYWKPANKVQNENGWERVWLEAICCEFPRENPDKVQAASQWNSNKQTSRQKKCEIRREKLEVERQAQEVWIDAEWEVTLSPFPIACIHNQSQ